MLINTKLKTDTTEVMAQQEVINLGLINREAANAPEMNHDKQVESRLRRDRRNRRNSLSGSRMWRVSMW